MKAVYTITIILLFSSTCLYSWRIENNYLIIERGDNLWDISHSFYGSGLDYNKIWNLRLEKGRFTNPNLIYDGMRFYLPNVKIQNDDPIKIDTIISHEIPKKMDSIIYKMNSSLVLLDEIEDNTGYSWVELALEKILLSLALGIASGVGVWIITERKKFLEIFKK